MKISPEDIQLDVEQQRLIAELASKEDKPWQVVLRDVLQEGLRANCQHSTECQSHQPRKAGSAKGKIWMSPDFDEPLEEFKDYM